MQIGPEEVKYWEMDPDELEMMEDDRIYPPRFEVLVCGSHARELVTALICFRGMADISSDTTELVLEPHTPGGLQGGLYSLRAAVWCDIVLTESRSRNNGTDRSQCTATVSHGPPPWHKP